MPLDASIPLQAQVPPPQDPIAQYGRVMQLQSAMGQQKLQQAQLTGANQENQMRQTQMDQLQKMNAIYQQNYKPAAGGGAPQLDTDGVMRDMAAQGLGSRIPEAMEAHAKFQKSLTDAATAQTDLAGKQADAAGMLGLASRKANYEPNQFLAGLQDSLNAKAINPQIITPVIAQIHQALQQDPTGKQATDLVKQFAETSIAKSPKAQESLMNAGKGNESQSTADKNNAELPGVQAKSAFEVLQRATSQLAAAPPKNVDDYVAQVSAFDPATAKAILAKVPPSQYDPQKSIAVFRNLGMNTQEQTTTAQAATNQAETARHNQAEEAHNQVEEGQGQQRIGIEGRKLATEQYNAGLGPDGKPLAGSNLTGDDFLKTLPFGLQQRVKAITDGREPIPTGRAASSGAGRQLAEAVTQYDPGYSVQRGHMRSAFTTGSQGQNIGALSTAAVHIDQYTQALQAMQNGTFRPGTEAYNNFRATFGNSAPTTAQGIANAVAGETATALKGNATDPEIASVKSAMPQNGSPQQIADYAKAQLHVLGAKLNTYDERFQAVSPGDKWTPVLPSAQQVFDKYGVKPLTRFGGGPNASGGAAQPGNNSGGHIIALNGKQYQYKGSGATDDLGNYTEIKK